MEVQAITKFARMSPKKIRPLAIILRRMNVNEALVKLKYHKSKSAKLLSKTIHSAVHNAKNNYNLKEDNLKIQHLTVDAGPSAKRYWFRSRGSSDRLLKRTSHLKVILTEIKPTLVKKPVAQKPVSPIKPDQPANEPVAKSSGLPTAPHSLKDGGKQPGAKRGLGRIFTPRTTNK